MPNELLDAIRAANEQQLNLVNKAWTQGVRDGLEIAGNICDAIVEKSAVPLGEPERQIMEFLRDQFRFSALILEAPPVIPPESPEKTS